MSAKNEPIYFEDYDTVNDFRIVFTELTDQAKFVCRYKTICGNYECDHFEAHTIRNFCIEERSYCTYLKDNYPTIADAAQRAQEAHCTLADYLIITPRIGAMLRKAIKASDEAMKPRTQFKDVTMARKVIR